MPNQTNPVYDINAYLTDPKSYSLPDRGDPNKVLADRDAGINQMRKQLAAANMNIEAENMAPWFIPDRKRTVFTTDMPPGMYGTWWPSPAPAEAQLHPTGWSKELYGGKRDPYFDPVDTFIHEVGGHAQEPGTQYSIDAKYWGKNPKKRKEFIQRMTKVLDYPYDQFVKNYENKDDQMDELRARLLAKHGTMPYGKGIWAFMNPEEINWFLESARKDWRPQERKSK